MTIAAADMERHCLLKHKAINYHDFRRNFIREFLHAFRRCFAKLDDTTLFLCILEDLWKFSNAPPSASKQIQANVDAHLAELRTKKSQKIGQIQVRPLVLAANEAPGATLVYNPATKTFGLAVQAAAAGTALQKLKIVSVPKQAKVAIQKNIVPEEVQHIHMWARSGSVGR